MIPFSSRPLSVFNSFCEIFKKRLSLITSYSKVIGEIALADNSSINFSWQLG